jgi:hypothetical protein
MLDITNIPAPRVPLVDEKTGLISREWYRFLLNLFRLTGGGSNDVTLTEVQYPPVVNPGDQQNTQPVSIVDLAPVSLGLDPVVDPTASITREDLQSLVAATDAAAMVPLTPTGLTTVSTDTTLTGSGTVVSPLGVAKKSPVTITADYTVLDTDQWIINNKAAAACTLTLPAAATWPGRPITVQNYALFLVNSVASDVVPLGGGAAGTAILLGVVGNWATLVSNGTNWVVMQAAPNNILLLE